MNTRCYRSKIGRLPFAVRNELNERIRDGAQGAELLDWLNGLKETRKILREQKSGPINAQNLTDWRSSGYRDWLDDQDRADIAPLIKKYLRPGDSEEVRKALEVVILDRKVSTSYLQRRLKIGYNRAAEIVDLLEERQVVGPPSGSGNKREILIFDGTDFADKDDF